MIRDVDKIPMFAFNQTQIIPKTTETSDTIIASEKARHENMMLLDECRQWWDSLRDFRMRRRRARRYHRGVQWGDAMQDPKNPSRFITEEQHIRAQGNVPLKQNIIRQLLKNLLGQYRSNQQRPMVISRTDEGEVGAEMLTNAIMHVHDINYGTELDARTMEEFALSGMAIQKINYKHIKTRNQPDVKTQKVNPNRIFLNTDIEDIRGDDIRIIGEIIDMPIEQLISLFAKNPSDEAYLRKIYQSVPKSDFLSYTRLDAQNIDNLDFYFAEDSGKARLYEIWGLKSEWRTRTHDFADGTYEVSNITMDEIAHINRNRIAFSEKHGIPKDQVPLIEATSIKEDFWYVKYMTPYGDVLMEGESPYFHQEHPYITHLYPLIDGEVWGFVEDIIDQQRYINRMIILMDFIMGASAKGLLMVPEDAIPSGMTPESFAEEWRSFNGVIVYKPSKLHNEIPRQITAHSTAVGLTDMLQFQLQFISDISGVHGAIQGRTPRSGTPASLYAQESANASLNTLDLFMSFNMFLQKRDEKVLKLIMQYYTEPRYLAVAGDTFAGKKKFDPEKVKSGLFDLKVVQSIETPVYKHMLNDTLITLLQSQMIDVKTYLENSSLPYSKSVLESLKKRESEAMQGAGVPLDGTSPEAQKMIQQAVGMS